MGDDERVRGKLEQAVDQLLDDFKKLNDEVHAYRSEITTAKTKSEMTFALVLGFGTVIVAAMIGVGLFDWLASESVHSKLGENTEAVATLKETVKTQAAAVDRSAESVTALAQKVEHGQRVIAQVPEEVKSVATSLDDHGKTVASLQTSMRAMASDMAAIKIAVQKVDTLQEATAALQKSSEESEKALARLQTGINELSDPFQPAQSNDVVIRFVLSSANRNKAQAAGRYEFDVPLVSAAPIARGNVRDIRVSLDPFPSDVDNPIPTANCAATVPQDSVLRITLRVASKSEAAVDELLTKGRISGEAILRLVAPIVEEP